MLLFKKKNKEEIIEEKKESIKETCTTELVQATIEDSNEKTENQSQEKAEENAEGKSHAKCDKNVNGEEILSNLQNLSVLLNTDVESLTKEIYLTQIRKIMSKLQKTVVRFDMTEEQMEKIFLSVNQYGLGGITVAPAYLSNCVRQIKKHRAILNLCSIIDFPFGESSIKAKISNVKESMKIGANSVAVAMPSMMFNVDNLKMLKKQCKTLCRVSKKRAGIVINASDVNEDNYSKAMKVLSKTKLSFIVLAFGEATKEEVQRKLTSFKSCKVAKRTFVLANVESVESAVELFKLNVDSILTPYADEIGEDLLKRFSLI